MKTKDRIISEVNKLLNENLTDQFNRKEELTEYGDITIKNSRGEQVKLQGVMFNWELHYVIIGYEILLERKKEGN